VGRAEDGRQRRCPHDGFPGRLRQRNRLDLFLTAAVGEHPYIEGSVYRKGKHVEITSSSKVRVEIDGDPGGFTPVTIDLLPMKLPFIVP